VSAGYRAIQWNRHKRVYDCVLSSAAVTYIIVFVGLGILLHSPPRQISLPILLMRALGTLAILLLHVILAIGPLARLDDRFAPFLYNRRHLGVSFFLVALMHAVVATVYYGGSGVRFPVSALVAGTGSFASLSGFPFELLGLLALLIFFLMAATSHDFWLANLSPRVWKRMHMLVYLGYAFVLFHVALGALQSERSPVFAVTLVIGAVALVVLHATAGVREWRKDARGVEASAANGWVDAGDVGDIPENGAKVVCLKGRGRVAVFRSGGTVSAVSNECAHQGGPLGEGRIIDGCITCPWHGYQYLPGNGQSPPPFTERIPTYEVRLHGRRIMLNPEALAPGTPVKPAVIPAHLAGGNP